MLSLIGADTKLACTIGAPTYVMSSWDVLLEFEVSGTHLANCTEGTSPHNATGLAVSCGHHTACCDFSRAGNVSSCQSARNVAIPRNLQTVVVEVCCSDGMHSKYFAHYAIYYIKPQLSCAWTFQRYSI